MKIIVVEDNKKHALEACDFFEGKGYQISCPSKFEPVLGESLSLVHCLEDFEAIRSQLEGTSGEVGVLTDLYFPVRNPFVSPTSGELAPLGLIVMMVCKELGVPCVLVTAGFHHGSRYEEPTQALRVLGMPFQETVVDHFEGDANAEAQTKDWTKALEKLETQVSRTGAG